MQINLTGHHIEVTDSLRDHVNEKMARLERHFDKVSNTHVILTVEGARHKAEATVHMSGNDIFANCTELSSFPIKQAQYADGAYRCFFEQIYSHTSYMTAC